MAEIDTLDQRANISIAKELAKADGWKLRQQRAPAHQRPPV